MFVFRSGIQLEANSYIRWTNISGKSVPMFIDYDTHRWQCESYKRKITKILGYHNGKERFVCLIRPVLVFFFSFFFFYLFNLFIYWWKLSGPYFLFRFKLENSFVEVTVEWTKEVCIVLNYINHFGQFRTVNFPCEHS